MGAINGFRIDANNDGQISRQELKAAKDLGIDVSALDKDNDGNVDAGVKIEQNSIMTAEGKTHIFEYSHDGNGKVSIFTTTVAPGQTLQEGQIVTNPDGTRTVYDATGLDERRVEVTEEALDQYHNTLDINS